MTAPKEQVGQRIACPDCRTPVTVPAKFASRRPQAARAAGGLRLVRGLRSATPAGPAGGIHCRVLRAVRHADAGGARPGGKRSHVPGLQPRKGRATATAARQARRFPTTESSYGSMRKAVNRRRVGRQSGARRFCLSMRHAAARAGRRGGPAIDLPRLRPIRHGAASPGTSRPKPDPTKEIEGQYDTKRERPTNSKHPSPIGRQCGSPAGSAKCWTNMADCPRSRRHRAGRSSRECSPSRGTTEPGEMALAVGCGDVDRGDGTVGLEPGPGHRGGRGPRARQGPAVLSMLFLVLADCLAAGWAGVFFVNLLAILGDTAAGADEMGTGRMPSAFLDWAGNTFFVINSLALSVLGRIGLGLAVQSGRTARRICDGRNAGRAISVGVALHVGSELALDSAFQGGVPQPGA